MERPYIICHMVSSIDGRVTGDFLFRSACANATDIYYRLNREMKSDGFICGRVTMEQSFTGGWYPDLSPYDSSCYEKWDDFIAPELSGFYAIAFDTYGKLGWRSDKIIDPDADPGYDGAQIIEVLSEQVDARYLSYLRDIGISYIFAGKDSIDITLALTKLKSLFGCTELLLEGGSVINGAFKRAGAVDELSLVIAPSLADKNAKPLFTDADISDFELIKAESIGNELILNYKIK